MVKYIKIIYKFVDKDNKLDYSHIPNEYIHKFKNMRYTCDFNLGIISTEMKEYFKKKIKKQIKIIFYNKHNKPLLDNINFNISHSNVLCVAISDKNKIGIDVEYIEEQKIKNNIINFSKFDDFFLENEPRTHQHFSKKEAVIKYFGCGFSIVNNLSILDDKVKIINNKCNICNTKLELKDNCNLKYFKIIRDKDESYHLCIFGEFDNDIKFKFIRFDKLLKKEQNKLIKATINNNLYYIQKHLNINNINDKIYGITCLYVAIFKKKAEIINYIIDNFKDDINLNILDDDNQSLLDICLYLFNKYEKNVIVENNDIKDVIFKNSDSYYNIYLKFKNIINKSNRLKK